MPAHPLQAGDACLSSGVLCPQDISLVQLCLPRTELGSPWWLRSTGVATSPACSICPTAPVHTGRCWPWSSKGDSEDEADQADQGDALLCHPVSDGHVQGCLTVHTSQLCTTSSGYQQPQMLSVSRHVPWCTPWSLCPRLPWHWVHGHMCRITAFPAVPGQRVGTPGW